MNKYEEIRVLNSLFEVESGLNTRISELAEYTPAQKIVDKLFKLNYELNNLLNDRLKELGVDGEFGVVPPDTSHLNDDDFGAFIRGELTL
jgi:hypothetical protein